MGQVLVLELISPEIHFTLYTLQFTLYTLQLTLCTLQFTLDTFTLHIKQIEITLKDTRCRLFKISMKLVHNNPETEAQWSFAQSA